MVISHGLWESPRDLQGWAEYLSANGYTVLLPEHQGSDADQQKAMLVGDQPPPGPQELRLRAMDVTAMLSAVESGGLLSRLSLNTDEVAVVGHSWGATTAIQLAGARSTDVKLSARCHNQDHPERNISWILQCSWLSKMNESSVEDSRVKAVVAVSPPLRLLFDPSRTSVLTAKVLLVSGTRDWVVPPDTDTVYTHPTSAGNKHIPAGGASGNFLKYSSDGTAVWATPSYTTDTNTTTTADVLTALNADWGAS